MISWPPSHRISFRISILTLVASIALLTSGLTLLLTYWENQDAARRTASTLFAETADHVIDQISSLLSSPVRLAKLGTATTETSAPIIDADGTRHPAFPLLRQALLANSSLYSVYVGHADGTFLQVISAKGNAQILAQHEAPAATQFIVRTITLEPGGTLRHQHWRFLDHTGQVLTEREDIAPDFDPRQRPWYQAAWNHGDATLSAPYVFNSLQALGFTASAPLAEQRGALGVDITLSGLSAFLDDQTVSRHSRLYIFDDAGHIVAASSTVPGQSPLPEILIPPPKRQEPDSAPASSTRIAEIGGDASVIHTATWQAPLGQFLHIGIIAPLDDFTEHLRRLQQRIGLGIGVVLLLAAPMVIWLVQRLSRVLRRLAADADRVREWDFSGTPPQESFVREFHSLATAFTMMKQTVGKRTRQLEEAQDQLEKLVRMGIALSAERNANKLMDMILSGARELTNAEGATLYVLDQQDGRTLRFEILHNDRLQLDGKELALKLPPVPLYNEDGSPNLRNVASVCLHRQTTIVVDDAYRENRFDFTGTRAFDALTGFKSQSFLAVPLKTPSGTILGVLQLINARDAKNTVIPFPSATRSFIEALAAQAATAMQNRDLLADQERLLDAMIHVIAGAIDAKSPYTGGHCARVPKLALMLAEAAEKTATGPLASFHFASDEERREFRIGAWLHDCGKMTTPEHIVDKATKLETIHNRIHEIRTRFEILLRDAQIDGLKKVAAGTWTPDKAAAELSAAFTRLDDDFVFVAACNIGSEAMASDDQDRLEQISRQTWTRHFSDRLGLSQAESQRLRTVPEPPLPCEERLLMDRPEHLIAREAHDIIFDPTKRFRLEVPRLQANLGELYNLSIRHGTLTAEERYKINEHVVQTLLMLESMPFPKNLRRIPEYAGTHHETLTGTGYPRRLTAEQLSVPARIMAIADIFEALTASDRPYKKAKRLSEAIDILSGFRNRGHIDPDLFDLLLTSGVYRLYAEDFLAPEQLDEVDLTRYLRNPQSATAPIPADH